MSNAAFEALKKSSKKSIDHLVREAEKVSGGKKSYNDDRFWTPTRDKSGNAYAVIRFLPAPNEAEGGVSWIRYWDHGFQGPTGRWYIEKSRTSIPGEADPLSELNSKLWNSGKDEDKETVRKQKRRLHYVSNILVIQDSANPENEGKVMLYKYGAKVFDKIMSAMKPEFEDEESFNPFNMWTGANFKLKIRQVEGWPNYDKSEFDKVGEIYEDESKLEEIFTNLYDIGEFVDPANYKSYGELQAKLKLVLGEEASTSEEIADYTPERSEESVIERTTPVAEEKLPASAEDEDEDISFFTGLANDDD